jgi:hypothetical protein
MANSRLTAGCYRADSRLLQPPSRSHHGPWPSRRPGAARCFETKAAEPIPSSTMTPYLHQSAMITQAKQPV